MARPAHIPERNWVNIQWLARLRWAEVAGPSAVAFDAFTRRCGLRDAATLESMLRREGFEVELSEWRASFIRVWRVVERAGGGRVESLRYRLCVRGRR